jgi:hypothetical protein
LISIVATRELAKHGELALLCSRAGKKKGVKLTEMVMEAAKVSRTAQHTSELLSCDEK